MTTKRSYKKADLDKYIEENEIELIGEYENVNRDTRIRGKCKTEGCEGIFEKSFRDIIRIGAFCKECTKEKGLKKRCFPKNVVKWNTNYELLKEYMKNNDNECPPNGYKTENNINLGHWCGTQRGFKKENKLSQEKINKLDELDGWWWECNNDLKWEEEYINVEKIVETTHKLPANNTWILSQRKAYKENTLSEYRKNKLENLGGGNIWYWHESEEWDKHREILLDYITEFKLEKIPVNEKRKNKEKIIHKNFNIGSWCQVQRANYKNDKLSEYRIKKLEEINIWYWSWDDMNFNKHFNCLIKYIQNNKNQLPKQEVTLDNINIGAWISDRRQDYRLGRLSVDKIKKFENIDIWYWEKDDFKIKYDLLKEYMINNNNRLPKIDTEYQNIKLGNWCDGRRQDYKNNRLSKERIIMLEHILDWYWSFDIQTDYIQIIRKEWWTQYNNLIKYQKTNPGKIPSQSDADSNIKTMGIFLGKQRRLKNKKCRKDERPLSKEKIDLLEKISGWRWDLRCSVCKFYQARKNDICIDCRNPDRNPTYQKTKEWTVVNNLRRDLPDTYIIHNKSVGNECSLQDREDTNGHLYPDIRFELFGFDLIVEVDEHRHRGAGYSCDERRMYDIVAKLGLPCVFIRYNPDDKKSDYNILLEMIKEYLEKDMNEIYFNEYSGLKTEYLFY